MNQRWRVGIVFCCLVLCGAGTNFALRRTLSPVFNETALILEVKAGAEAKGVKSPAEFFSRFGGEIWGAPGAGGPPPIQHFYYRPLEILSVAAVILYSYIFHPWPWLPVALSSLFLGLAGGVIYLLGWRLTRDAWAAAGGAWLMMFSLPSLTAAWVSAASIQSLVPLLVGVVLLCYERYRATGRRGWVVPMVLIGYFGPLYKEFIGVAGMMIVVLEARDVRRHWRFMLLWGGLVFNSFAPSWLIHMVFYGQGAAASTYVSAGIVENFLHGRWRTEMLAQLGYCLSPLLMLLGLAGVLMSWGARRGRWMTALGGAAAVMLWASFFAAEGGVGWSWAGAGVVSALVLLSVSAWRIHPLLAVWAFFSWLPFLFVSFNSEVHLLYALGPVGIIVLWHIRRLAVLAWGWGRRTGAFVATLLWLGVFVAVADQTLNLTRVYRHFKDTRDGAQLFAQTFQHVDASAGRPLLISRSRQAKDVEYYALQQGTPVVVNDDWTEREIDPHYVEESVLAEVLKAQTGDERPVFLLMSLNASLLTPRFVAALNHRYILDPVLIRQQTLRDRYLDISKYLIPPERFPYPGTPDMRFGVEVVHGGWTTRTSYASALFRLRLRPSPEVFRGESF